jgi:F-type H+-transporting ATPase subunit delta
MKISKEARRASRQLFRVCMVDGKLDEGRVRQVVTKVSGAKPRAYMAILEAFVRQVRDEVQRQCAQVESASELDSTMRSQLQQSLNHKYGRPLALEFSLKPELLGGIRVRVGSDVWDGTVKARLEALRSQLS